MKKYCNKCKSEQNIINMLDYNNPKVPIEICKNCLRRFDFEDFI